MLYYDSTHASGPMAEWLGKGLQNPVQRFNSASHLHFAADDFSLLRKVSGFCVCLREEEDGS